MSSFSIKPEHAKGIAEEEGSWIKELASIELRISSAKNGIELGAATARFKSRLGALASDVNQERRGMKEMKKGLENANSSYIQTENKLLGNDSRTEKTTITKLISGLAGMALFPQGALSALLFYKKFSSLFKDLWPVLFPDFATGENHLLTDFLQYKIDNSDNPFLDLFGFKAEDDDEIAKASINMIKTLHDSDLSDDNFLKKRADKLKAFNDKRKHQFSQGYFDEDGKYHSTKGLEDDSEEKKKFDDISSLDKVATIASVGTKVSGDWWDHHWGSSDEEFKEFGAHGSAEVAVGKAEASASAYAGMYSYSSDGTKHFTPGFGAEVGVGVTAFSASAKGQLGDEYFNLHGNASVDVGKVDASAAVNVGLFGPDGKLNPQAGVSLKAEALAAEAKVTGGGTIAGTSVEATGSVNFGVGAHADFGLRDGHLSVDIGASLGVGVGVKLDIDMSGTINAVSDFASDAWTGVTEWVSGWFK